MGGKLRSPSFRPRRPSSFFRYLIVAVLFLFAFYTLRNGSRRSAPLAPPPEPAIPPVANEQTDQTTQGHPDYPPPGPDAAQEKGHPIDQLIDEAETTFNNLLAKESKSLEEAAAAYRKRRGRHPPPGFDAWFNYAWNSDAIIIEDFFDQIYQDLEPFWGIAPDVIRKEAWSFEMKIHVRNQKTNTTSDWFWTLIWKDMIDSIVTYLPDMDIPLNAMDEPRLVVPWEDINSYMEKASTTHGFPPANEVKSVFQKLPRPGLGDPETKIPTKHWEEEKPYWPIARRGCPPGSRARASEVQLDFDHQPTIEMTNAEDHMYKGFVSNYSLSGDLCHQPDLQGLEGVIINPISVSTSRVLFPMFGGSKLGVNNEILLPAPVYWDEQERFTGGNSHGGPWRKKNDKVIWRGVATGGENLPENWRGFQRHRFVAMNNSTKLALVESGVGRTENFAMPDDQYHLGAHADKTMSTWVKDWSDVGFVDLMCHPTFDDGTCYYTDLYFHPIDGLKMKEQFKYKYVPDIDGNSFSGRYLGFLRSTSLPIKATLFKEWHDSRIVAWKHFVPMDNRFVDFYGIMEYFLGYNGKGGHDEVAEKLALDGKKWAEKVLRKEDMQIYALRLLLEYARILDDNREKLGWVGDALKDPAVEEAWKSFAK
ncbi:hypothetical protein B0T10DRAFT_396573 [Thelonectria olida]|uniref:Glycosyl transferase CAP10 domain-containing protein n=1 Tax=Thelonectria olida TaxID=1576542 RepID=A0A9P8WBQ4_9HYPO|nr:hypothetical protein B0T10DRAFT_396573 [Thelonectria olida]